jgi:hypothetical protein
MLPAMKMVSRWPRSREAIVLVGLVLAFYLPAPQAPSQETSDDLEVAVVGQPVSYGAKDQLGLRIKITNPGPDDLEGFTVQVGAGSKVTTRSTLHTIFGASRTDTIGSVAIPFEDRTVGAGSSAEVVIEEPISSLQGISLSGQEGVYPLGVFLTEPNGAELASTVTTILYYPNRPQARLKIVPVLPLNDRPARDPAGNFAPDESGSYPLEEAVDPRGWLASYLQTLEELSAQDLSLALAPTPRLVEEVLDLSDGYRRVTGEGTEPVEPQAAAVRAAEAWLDDLRVVTDRPSVQPLLVPYGFVDLPSIASGLEVGSQLKAGSDILSDALGPETASRAGAWLMPPEGRMDEATYDQLPLGVEHVIFSFDSLSPLPSPELSGCPRIEFSFTCPVRVETAITGPKTGLVLDENLQQHLDALGRQGDTRRELQQFFAETAMIREEQPARSDRVIAFAPPATWKPRPGASRTLLRGLARAPWLETMTPAAALDQNIQVRRRTVVGELERGPSEPDLGYFERIRSIAAEVAQFRSINPPAETVERLTRNVLVAQSRTWWPDPIEGMEYARSTQEEIAQELGRIQITGPQEITLTSKTGQIQFVILNETGYEVDVNVLVASENLTLRGEGFSPEDIVSEQHVASKQQRITFEVTTRASGIFPVQVRLQTPDGRAIGDPVPLTIRSTEFNEIALGITFGALAFLILFYVVRAIRRRRMGGGSLKAPEA